MSDCVEYESLMDYIKAANKFNNDNRIMLYNLIHVLSLKGILDYREIDYIRNGGFYEYSNNSRNTSEDI